MPGGPTIIERPGRIASTIAPTCTGVKRMVFRRIPAPSAAAAAARRSSASYGPLAGRAYGSTSTGLDS